MHRPLYPPIEPYRTGRLRVSELHELYFEECGNPGGKPALFVHGGPGGGSDAKHRRFWDPARYRVVLFDQRGCGRSTPHAELRENTTWDLVADIERLRVHLGVERWQVFGGSWGSTLSLLYAQRHPERVTELVLRGIFMARRREIHWYYQEGASRFYPDRWEEFLAPIPEAERADLVGAYHARLTADDTDVRLEAARAWATWEGATSLLVPDPAILEHTGEARFAEAFARIECHYFFHRAWLERDDQILADVHRIRHVPAVIVHGRYDVICPIETAWELHRAWPEARLAIVQDAGHSALEPGITSALVEATDGFA